VVAVDHPPPLISWELPEEHAALRRLIEGRMGKPGKRERSA